MIAPGSRPYQRRQWLVNRQLQLRFVRAMVLVLCIMAVATMASVCVATRFLLAAFELAQEPLFVWLMKTLCWLIALELMVITPFVIWFGVRLTHKVAGPLVRILAAIQQMAQGDFSTHLTLRKGDSLTELAEAVNFLAASLRRDSSS